MEHRPLLLLQPRSSQAHNRFSNRASRILEQRSPHPQPRNTKRKERSPSRKQLNRRAIRRQRTSRPRPSSPTRQRPQPHQQLPNPPPALQPAHHRRKLNCLLARTSRSYCITASPLARRASATRSISRRFSPSCKMGKSSFQRVLTLAAKSPKQSVRAG